MKTYSFSKLYFKHIPNTKLFDLGVSAPDLAKQLADHGYIEILEGGRYIELPKMHDPKFTEDYFRTVWSTKPSFPRTAKNLRTLAIILLLCLGGLSWKYRATYLDQSRPVEHQTAPSQERPSALARRPFVQDSLASNAFALLNRNMPRHLTLHDRTDHSEGLLC